MKNNDSDMQNEVMSKEDEPANIRTEKLKQLKDGNSSVLKSWILLYRQSVIRDPNGDLTLFQVYLLSDSKIIHC